MVEIDGQTQRGDMSSRVVRLLQTDLVDLSSALPVAILAGSRDARRIRGDVGASLFSPTNKPQFPAAVVWVNHVPHSAHTRLASRKAVLA